MSRVIDQDATHDLRRDPKEVRTISPMNVFLIDETEVSLIYQRSGLEGMPLPLALQIAVCQATKLVVDQRIQLIQGALISIAPLSKQMSYLMGRKGGGSHG